MIKINKNGVDYILTAEEEAEHLANIAKLKEEKKSTQYQFDRMREYPSAGEQFDIIFHQGLDAWKEQIQAIKDKYPKGEQ
jgi:copper homeostasis protein CutC